MFNDSIVNYGIVFTGQTYANGYKCIESKKEGKNQVSIQSSTTPDLGYQWESDNFTMVYV